MREVSEVRKWGFRRTYGLITGDKLGDRDGNKDGRLLDRDRDQNRKGILLWGFPGLIHDWKRGRGRGGR